MIRLMVVLGLALIMGCAQQNPSPHMRTQSLFRISAVDTSLPVNKHTVQPNDTLWKISQQYHVNIEELLKLNPNLAGDAPFSPDHPITIPANESMAGYEQQVLQLTNQKRQEAGLSPCAGNDSNLNRSARAKSQDMASNNYFSHESPTYGDPFAMMRNFGVQYQSAGENIAMGQPTPQEVVTAWMNSPGHRKNIMNGSFTHLGVGYVLQNGRAYWTQQFIGK
ncbi:CAP domain-containing protein [Cohnella sp.]|uniref:CAP domain-containing protein n=1 Tax=Cohnella sp. TaxID=1883426 RepID=UPI003567B168